MGSGEAKHIWQMRDFISDFGRRENRSQKGYYDDTHLPYLAFCNAMRYT